MNQNQSNISNCISNSIIFNLKKLIGMKKIFIVLLSLLAVLTVNAQTNLTDQTQTFVPYWTIGIQNGIAQSYGFVNNKNFFSKLSKESKQSFGLSIERQLSPLFSLKAKYSNSSYFSNGNRLLNDLNDYNLISTGKINEFGIYGSVDLKRLFRKNKNKESKWNVYVSAGIGYSNWKSDLKNKVLDEDTLVAYSKNSTIYDIRKKDTSSINAFSKFTFPLAFGVNYKILDGFSISLEHTIHFMNTGLLDVYSDGFTNHYTTTTIGISVKLDKMGSGHQKKKNVVSVSTTPKQTKQEKKSERSSSKGTSKAMPELQEYTDYNALLPPPTPKVDTSLKAKPALTNANKNVWAAEKDSGRVEITGGKNLTNAVVKDTVPMVTGLVPSYRIQIQASKTYIPADAVIKKQGLIEKLSVELRSDGWYRYYVGQFTSLPEAKKKLAEMRAKGIKDSFVVSFKSNKREIIK
jgi:hypothetical protein